MWPDRLSNQPPPRQYSTSPRRPSHLGPGAFPTRPPYSPRSSSLSLPLNQSSSSLSAPGRPANGSNLRQSTVASTPGTVSDPLEVLSDIIGNTVTRTSSSHTDESRPAVLEDIDFGTLSIQEFAAAESEKKDHRNLSNGAPVVQDYETEEAKFEDLHLSITACDEVLKSVETYLASFQADLGNVSSEIESLQSRSTALNKRLDNRKQVERLLGPIVEDISISPSVIKKLSEGPIDDSWAKTLRDLERRLKSVEDKSESTQSIKAFRDAQPLLRNLIDKALERIRDYFVAQIKALRSPNINSQIIQRQKFLPYKDLFAFLAKSHPQLAEEISQAYTNTMRWYYHGYFQRYEIALGKVKLHVIDKNDALAVEDSARRGTVLGTSRPATAPHDAFSLGRRTDLLKSGNRLALSSYLAEEDKSTHHLEVPFRNFNLALVDNASVEYSFLSEFLGHNSFHQISRKFAQIFETTCVIGQSLTKNLIDSSVDGLGVLFCVRLNQRFAFDLQRRKVPTLDSYINGINMLLWPRFQKIMDVHCESFRKATTSSMAGNAAPHPFTQKFAQLLQGITALSSEAGDDEPISSSLSRLRGDFETFLTRAAKTISEPRKRRRFLFNNFSLILTILGETNGKLAQEQREYFKDAAEQNAEKRSSGA
ncbi:MAG: hypothetical protein M1814_001025 [Vezdaea aestivalis]|nr:MAG: hypothetical protein M1814_001025 [Vezdaea aestivalis]